MQPSGIPTEEALILAVRDVLIQSFASLDGTPAGRREIMEGASGKMLRTRMASAFLGGLTDWPAGLEQSCAAVEIVHTASLFHDDVVDGASLRRGRPSLWRLFTPNAAILFGDILFCEAFGLFTRSAAAPLLPAFLDKVREVCTAEAEQELSLRGNPCDLATCRRIARSKTGALFAFAGFACGGSDKVLANALCEAGYAIGTAYQLADDLLDEIGSEADTGKTLGTDRLRRKFTLAQDGPSAAAPLKSQILELCQTALRLLSPWPDRRTAAFDYINRFLMPACFQDTPARLHLTGDNLEFVFADSPVLH